MNARLFILLSVSILLIALDTHTSTLRVFREVAFLPVKPLVEIAQLPTAVTNRLQLQFEQRELLQERNRELKKENIALRARLNDLQVQEQRSNWLSELLGARETLDYAVLPAKPSAIQLQPLSQKIVIDRGNNDDIFVGQPVVDHKGIIGQITSTTRTESAVTLVTDPNHSIPVRIRRNGVLAIAHGSGYADRMRVTGLRFNADIQEGDILVTSGLGERFPSGYPVAEVTSVVRNQNTAFAEITAVPLAAFDTEFEVLLVWTQMPGEGEESILTMHDSGEQ